MWGKRKGPPKVRGRLGGFLDDTSEFDGKYTCTGTVVIDAKFHGEIRSKDTLLIGAQAVVHARVETTILVVRGELVGNVTAHERVELKRNARVTGDIEAPIIMMEEGAVHDGQCRMAKAQSAGAEAPLSVVIPLSKA